jgi:hypothetical protein
MKNKLIGGLAVLLMIFGVSICGCMEDNKSQAKEMVDLLPNNYNGFVYVSFKNIEDSEYSSEYRSKILKSLIGANGNIRDEGDKTGIYINKTKNIIMYDNGNYRNRSLIMIIEGDYDFDKLKKYLKEENNVKFTENYKGFEIYANSKYDDTALIIYNDKIIVGTKNSVYDCIDVIKGDKEPLSKNEKVMEIFNKLPSDACIMIVGTGKRWDNTIARGVSITFKDNDRVKVYSIFKYNDEKSAQSGYKELSKSFEKEKKKPDIDGSVKLDGVFVIGTAEGPAKELKL